MFIIAHADEIHETTIESTLHSLGPWYIAVPSIIAAIVACGYLVYLVTNKNMGTTILIEALLLLVVGFLTASTYPLLSVAAMTIGLAMAGFIAFSGLAAGK